MAPRNDDSHQKDEAYREFRERFADENRERFLQLVRELDRRTITLETNWKVVEAELISLRTSRHDQGNHINRHTLEIQELSLKMVAMTQQYTVLLQRSETLATEFTSFQMSIAAQLSGVKSDLRQTTWLVGLVAAGIVLVGRYIFGQMGL